MGDMSVTLIDLENADDADLASALAFPSGPSPWVRGVFVSSLDGATAVDGRAGGLGGPADRALFALHRALADVILVGSGTVEAEQYGPAETAPRWAGVRQGRAPTAPIAVVSRSLSFDPGAPLFTEAPDDARTMVVTCRSAPKKRRDRLASVAEVIVAGDDGVDLGVAVDELAARGYPRVSCEGGPGLLAQVAGAGRLDELDLTLSPVLVAGAARRVLDGPPLAHPQDMRLTTMLRSGDFLFLQYLRGRAE